MTVHDEGYSRNASCPLNQISTAFLNTVCLFVCLFDGV